MAQSYRTIQNQLKVDRKLGRVPTNFKLNQKKKVLVNRITKVLNKTKKEKRIVNRTIRNAPKDGTVTTIPINKYVSVKHVIEKMRPTQTHIPVIKFTFGNTIKYYALSNVNRRRLLATFGQDDNEIFQNVLNVVGGVGSDLEFTTTFTNKVVDNVDVYYMERKKRKKDGAFFPYTHNMDLDLSRYQIYKEDKEDNYKHNCFIHCLIKWGELKDEELQYIKSFCKNDHIPQTSFKEICKEIDIGIIVKRPEESRNNVRTVKFNANAKRVITICLIAEHYFLMEKVKVTSYAIKNYDEIKDKKEWYRIIDNTNKKKDRFISSYDVVRLLLENKDKRLTEIKSTGPVMKTSSYVHVDKNIESLEYTTSNYRKVEFKDKTDEKKSKKDIVYFDFETTTDVSEHQPYLCSAIYDDDSVKTFHGIECGLSFLSSLKNDSIIIIHNLGYDFRFLLKYLIDVSVVQPTNTTMFGATAKFKNNKKNINLTFKCSYAMIGSPLKDFAKMFNLKDVKKEIMPYGAYTRKSVKQDKYNIDEAKKLLKENEQEDFIKNINEWHLIDGDDFNHIKYSQYYCEADVKTTKRGYEQFRTWMKEITGLDIIDYLTIASIADAYLKKDGCYDGCYEFSGVPQQYLQEFVVGGRTMCRDNNKFHLTEELNDFDAVSLYPSAMHRMDGFVMGQPKILKNLTYAFLKKQDAYFVDIEVTKVGKKRHFPLLNKKTEEGIRLFDSELLGVHKVDKTTLEDLIEFHDIKFKVLRGYFFDEGRNEKINRTIEYLFKQRLAMKKAKNPIEKVYKLLMNSSYGKSIMKPIDTERKIIKTDDLDGHLRNNYNYNIESTVITGTNKTVVKLIKPINNHFNCGHIGSEILSMSKRIMNEVMCLAEDNGHMIYYQDTDSMHINKDSVNKLASEFKQKYHRDLIGKGMGQFHCDFEMGQDSGTEPYAVESIFLGKKCYIDKVKYVKDGKEMFGYHVRMKGVPNEIVNITSKKNHNGSLMDLFKYMFTGKSVIFDLLAGTKKFFVGGSDYSIKNRENLSSANGFIRKLQFK
jgi:hypothetical protein